MTDVFHCERVDSIPVYIIETISAQNRTQLVVADNLK